MAATLDPITIEVNILSSAPQVATQTFDYILLLLEAATFATATVKSFSSPAAIADDSELSEAQQARAQELWAQANNPGKLLIGEGGGATIGEDLDAALAADDRFYGVVLISRTAADIEAAATWCETNKRLLVAQSSDADVKTGAGILDTLTGASRKRSVLIFHDEDTEGADIAWAAAKLSAVPDQFSTTWAAATLSGITQDSLSGTERDAIIGADGNVYLSLGGVGATAPGKTCDGSFIDVVVVQDWLEARIEEAVAQLMLNVSARNSKIPYTDAGLQQIASAVRGVLARAESLGHLRKDSSMVDVPLVSTLSDSTIQSREATISASCVLAGAVDQKITVNLVVTEA